MTMKQDQIAGGRIINNMLAFADTSEVFGRHDIALAMLLLVNDAAKHGAGYARILATLISRSPAFVYAYLKVARVIKLPDLKLIMAPTASGWTPAWGHIVQLAHTDDCGRQFYIDEMRAHHWTVAKLREAIKGRPEMREITPYVQKWMDFARMCYQILVPTETGWYRVWDKKRNELPTIHVTDGIPDSPYGNVFRWGAVAEPALKPPTC